MSAKREKEVKAKSISTLLIDSVGFGIRFEPQYSVMDYIGSIVDDILYTEDTPFGPEVFPLSNSGHVEHRLFNDKTSDNLRITYSDVILQMKVKERNLDNILTIAENYEQYIFKSVREHSKLRGVFRYGMVFHHENCAKAAINTPIQHYILQDFPNAKTLSMRFSRKLAVEEALVRAAINDTRNAIYQVDEEEDGGILIAVDYQEYFKPSLEGRSLAEKKYADYAKRGIDYYLSEFTNWLGNLLEAKEVAS